MRLNDRGIIAFIQVAKLTDSEVAEIEKPKFNSSCSTKYLTIEVLPAPEGAENTISLPLKLLQDI